MKTPALNLEAAASAIRQAVEPLAGAGPLLVALDGRCAAGKTTLAAYLQRQTGWGLAHMDHFFLRPQQRTPARLAEPGGNVDRERFLEEVLLPLEAGQAAVYRPFDCHTQSLGEPLRLEPGPVLLVEGAMSAESIRKLCTAVQESAGGRCAVFAGEDGMYQYAVSQPDGDLRALAKEINAALNGRGGGKPGFIQGSVQAGAADIQRVLK